VARNWRGFWTVEPLPSDFDPIHGLDRRAFVAEATLILAFRVLLVVMAVGLHWVVKQGCWAGLRSDVPPPAEYGVDVALQGGRTSGALGPGPKDRIDPPVRAEEPPSLRRIYTEVRR
jgi:hypothetical protein